MNLFEAILLGIVQGLTEFLPISSSGHLVIGQHLLGIKVLGNAFEVVVHLGTLLSVLVVLWSDIWNLLITLKEKVTQKYIFAIIIGTIPAVVIGLLFKDAITEAFENIKVVATTLLITGAILFTTKFAKSKDGDISIGRGLLIGIAQAFAILPGISRSGMTISTAMHMGIKPEVAARFSFLLAVPAIAGAGLLTGLDLYQSSEPLLSLPIMLGGFASSFLVGWISLKWLLGLISKGKFHWFGIYCILIGLISWIV